MEASRSDITEESTTVELGVPIGLVYFPDKEFTIICNLCDSIIKFSDVMDFVHHVQNSHVTSNCAEVNLEILNEMELKENTCNKDEFIVTEFLDDIQDISKTTNHNSVLTFDADSKYLTGDQQELENEEFHGELPCSSHQIKIKKKLSDIETVAIDDTSEDSTEENRSELNKSTNTIHDKAKKDWQFKFYCIDCNTYFKSINEQVSHSCLKYLSNAKLRKICRPRRRLNQNSFACNYKDCDSVLNSEKELKKHELRHIILREPLNSKYKYKCMDCNQILSSRDDYLCHRKQCRAEFNKSLTEMDFTESTETCTRIVITEDSNSSVHVEQDDFLTRSSPPQINTSYSVNRMELGEENLVHNFSTVYTQYLENNEKLPIETENINDSKSTSYPDITSEENCEPTSYVPEEKVNSPTFCNKIMSVTYDKDEKKYSRRYYCSNCRTYFELASERIGHNCPNIASTNQKRFYCTHEHCDSKLFWVSLKDYKKHMLRHFVLSNPRK